MLTPFVPQVTIKSFERPLPTQLWKFAPEFSLEESVARSSDGRGEESVVIRSFG